jgi:hypothetical protein
MDSELPHKESLIPIGQVLPLANENRWSDLLAVLIEADPETASRATRGTRIGKGSN